MLDQIYLPLLSDPSLFGKVLRFDKYSQTLEIKHQFFQEQAESTPAQLEADGQVVQHLLTRIPRSIKSESGHYQSVTLQAEYNVPDMQKSIYAALSATNRLQSQRMFFFHLFSTPFSKNVKYALAKLAKKFKRK